MLGFAESAGPMKHPANKTNAVTLSDCSSFLPFPSTPNMRQIPLCLLEAVFWILVLVCQVRGNWMWAEAYAAACRAMVLHKPLSWTHSGQSTSLLPSLPLAVSKVPSRFLQAPRQLHTGVSVQYPACTVRAWGAAVSWSYEKDQELGISWKPWQLKNGRFNWLSHARWSKRHLNWHCHRPFVIVNLSLSPSLWRPGPRSSILTLP